ncbi:MutY C-terminal [Trinorchestia longiramus]|nr:MutY C-terminal [Trinorchestia longiramus]
MRPTDWAFKTTHARAARRIADDRSVLWWFFSVTLAMIRSRSCWKPCSSEPLNKSCNWEHTHPLDQSVARATSSAHMCKLALNARCRVSQAGCCSFLWLVTGVNAVVGLLASLWELPSIDVTSSEEALCSPASLRSKLLDLYSLPPASVSALQYVDDVVHIFSHIHQTYKVYVGTLADCPTLPVPSSHRAVTYMTLQQFESSAVSTAMKKVLKKAMSHWEKKANTEPSPKTARKMKQTTMTQFFSR